MNAREMLDKVQELKEQCVFNNLQITGDVIIFFLENWAQILDILDDTLYEYLNKR